MYEKIVVHAIQHTDTKDFEMRYRRYKTKEERDRTHEWVLKHEGVSKAGEKVTLTIIAETTNEQMELF